MNDCKHMQSLPMVPGQTYEGFATVASAGCVWCERDALQLQRAELIELLRQIHEAANKVYQMGDATARNVLVNIYEISGKILTIATAK